MPSKRHPGRAKTASRSEPFGISLCLATQQFTMNLIRLSCLAIFALSVSPLLAEEQVPIVTLDYAPGFDQALSEHCGVRVDQAAVEELESNIPRFQEAWAAQGPLLLKTAEQ